MKDSVIASGIIDPESPERLRALITALSEHTGRHVLRVEVGLGASTREGHEHSITMTVTHSLGPQHEIAIGPALANAFAETLNALSKKAHEQTDEEWTAGTGSAAGGEK